MGGVKVRKLDLFCLLVCSIMSIFLYFCAGMNFWLSVLIGLVSLGTGIVTLCYLNGAFNKETE